MSLRDVVCTSRDGDKFWKIPECYIRGNNIKYLRVPDEVIDKVVEEPKSMPPPPLPLSLSPCCVIGARCSVDICRFVRIHTCMHIYTLFERRDQIFERENLERGVS